MPKLVHNLETLFGIGHVPSDTSMRERLDALDPQALRPAFKAAFSELQRGNGLEGMTSIDGHHLISIHGTEFFKSESVRCANCCVRNKLSGKVEHFHQMVCASLVSTETGANFPLVMPEMVLRGDGSAKNDLMAVSRALRLRMLLLRPISRWSRKCPTIAALMSATARSVGALPSRSDANFSSSRKVAR